MAKYEGTVRLRGRAGNLVYINNRYGSYTRAVRGTYTPIHINQTLKTNANRTGLINDLASPLRKLFKDYTGINNDSSLWERMLKRMKSAATSDTYLLLQQLKGLNMHENYPLSRIWSIPKPQITQKGKQLHIFMDVFSQPDYPRRVKGAVGYRYQLIALFLPDNQMQWYPDDAYTDWILFSEREHAYEFSFTPPKGKGSFVLCLKAEAGEKWGSLDITLRPIDLMDSARTTVLEVGRYG